MTRYLYKSDRHSEEVQSSSANPPQGVYRLGSAYRSTSDKPWRYSMKASDDASFLGLSESELASIIETLKWLNE